jgi:hypothetical protein
MERSSFLAIRDAVGEICYSNYFHAWWAVQDSNL